MIPCSSNSDSCYLFSGPIGKGLLSPLYYDISSHKTKAVFSEKLSNGYFQFVKFWIDFEIICYGFYRFV